LDGETMNDQTQTTERAAELAAERKKRYKQSLNLPKTGFPMKANLAQNEPQTQKRWAAQGLYERIQEARAGKDRFVFHDGPPYANGSIHAGHLLNRVLKDLVVRSRIMMGQDCPFVPGWDCHGLPIEHRVLTELQEKGKLEALNDLPDDSRRMAIRRECQKYAAKYQKLQARQMLRLLTLADFENPYLTMRPEYEVAALEVFATLVGQGLVYRDLKPVHWSIANQTALAEAELEYRDRVDPSVYVAFDALDPAVVGHAFDVEVDEPVGFLIWTTTPWTLPANLLIAVHKDLKYSLVRLGDRLLVVADGLVDAVCRAADADAKKLGETVGFNLVDMRYRHPLTDRAFPDRAGRIVAADYVTLEDGTGLVHTAPGHGHDDYLTGLAEGVEIYTPVLDDGTFDDTVPEWLQGVSVWDANETVPDRLRDSGHLIAAADYEHSYPHDWRSKTPVIFRGTEQWFVAVDREMPRDGKSLRGAALEASHNGIRFIPEWGKKRLAGMLESRPDWCISRQRSWGLPIPSFRTEDGEVFLTAASVRAVAATIAREGSDAWFQHPATELLAEYDPASDPHAPHDLDIGSLTKMYDIFDVWFESGSSWSEPMVERGGGFPVDLYLEGSDQHRGWFQSSLLCGLGAKGMPPYKALLTHGFMVDRHGHKMSKSTGNALDVEELLKDFGADVCRWWVSSLAFENDMKVDMEYFKLAGESYRKVRNTLRFMLSNLSDFEPSLAVPLESLEPTTLDAYALTRATELRSRVLDAYEQFDFRRAHLLLFDFCNDTLSSFYLDALKDRLYCDQPDSERRRSAQSVMWKLTELLAVLLAPILPHTTDETWRALHGDDSCVHLETAPRVFGNAAPQWERFETVRTAAKKALEDSDIENPLDAGLVLPDPDGSLASLSADLADAIGVSRIRLVPEGEIEVLDLRDQPRCERSWRRDESVALRSDGGYLSDRDADAVDA
jgi:isoleucyl-tRNA synthetase